MTFEHVQIYGCQLNKYSSVNYFHSGITSYNDIHYTVCCHTYIFFSILIEQRRILPV